MIIKFKNFDVLVLIDILNSLELKSKESRMRTRFKNILSEHNINIIQQEKRQLIDEYAKFDENGQWIVKEDGNLDVSEDIARIINDNTNVLLCEEFTLTCDETNKDMMTTVANLILEGDFTVSGEYADAYDEWCTEFEEVLEFYNSTE